MELEDAMARWIAAQLLTASSDGNLVLAADCRPPLECPTLGKCPRPETRAVRCRLLPSRRLPHARQIARVLS